MSRIRSKVIAFLLCFGFIAGAAATPDRTFWLTQMSGSRLISEIVIPGTHDTGAYNIPTDIGETQDWNIATQLNNGIRFLDVRIADAAPERGFPFEIRHGIETLGNFNALILDPVNQFLDAHPGEVVFMSVSDEDTLNKDLFLDEVVFAANSKFHVHANNKTRLDDVRGKIVLFDRMALNGRIKKIHLESVSLPERVLGKLSINDVDNGFGGYDDGTLNLQENEYIIKVEAYSGSLVNYVKFTTNFGNVIASNAQNLPAGLTHTVLDNIRVVGISGRAGSLIDQLTIHYTKENRQGLQTAAIGGNGGGAFEPSMYGIAWGEPVLKIQDEYELDMHPTVCTAPSEPSGLDVLNPAAWAAYGTAYGLYQACLELPSFSLDYPKKARQVIEHLATASVSNRNYFWINFASANYQGFYIGNNAEVANAAVKDFFEDLINRPTFWSFGSIVLMDYPDLPVIDSMLNFNLIASKRPMIETGQYYALFGANQQSLAAPGTTWVTTQGTNAPQSSRGRFFVHQSDVEKIALKSVDNLYVVAEANGEVLADRINLGAWEKYTPVYDFNSYAAAFVTDHGYYLTLGGATLGAYGVNEYHFTWEPMYPASESLTLTGERSVSSANEKYTLVLQLDGNLVLYKKGQGAIWATNTVGSSADQAIFQADGNFVLYAGSTPVWASNTMQQPGEEFALMLRNNGELCIYNEQGSCVWSSGTAGM